MVLVCVTFQLPQEQREKALFFMKEKIETIIKEQGCVAYRFVEDSYEKNYFTIFSKWENAEVLEKHNDSPVVADIIAHFKQWGVSKAQFEYYHSGE